jgi:cadmium resistance protein CadD (predicted permease)
VSEILLISAVTVVAFVSTNFDSLLLLVPWFGASRIEVREIFLGYLLGVSSILAVSWVASSIVELAPARFVGWLGLLPIGLGVVGLAQQLRGESAPDSERPRPGGPLAIALLTISLGGDNLSVFIPLFAETPHSLDSVIVLITLVSAVAWGLLAERLSRAQSIGSALERWGPRLMPLLLIALGLFILLDTSTDTL